MIRQLIDRFSRWFNGLPGHRRVYYYFGFCLCGLLLLWLSIRFIRFDTQLTIGRVPQHIGKPSGPQFTDSLTKKH